MDGMTVKSENSTFGRHSTPGVFLGVHALLPALDYCVFKYMLQSSQSSMYHGRDTLVLINLCDKELNMWDLECSHVVSLRHTQISHQRPVPGKTLSRL